MLRLLQPNHNCPLFRWRTSRITWEHLLVRIALGSCCGLNYVIPRPDNRISQGSSTNRVWTKAAAILVHYIYHCTLHHLRTVQLLYEISKHIHSDSDSFDIKARRCCLKLHAEVIGSMHENFCSIETEGIPSYKPHIPRNGSHV